jgi:hypothetical protein
MVDFDQYANELVRLVEADRTTEPNRYREVRNWEDLHGVCDANEYVIAADENLGLDYDGSDVANEFRNEAISRASAILFRERTILVHLNITIYGNPDIGHDEVADGVLGAIEVGSDDESVGYLAGPLHRGDLASGNGGPVVVALAEEV